MQKNHIRVKTVAICSLDILLAVIICEAAVVGFSTVVSISNCASIMYTSVLLHSLYYCAVHAVQADGVTLQVFCELASSASNISSATGQAVLSALPKSFCDQPCNFFQGTDCSLLLSDLIAITAGLQ